MLVQLLGGEKKEGSGLFGVSILPTYVEREAVPIRPQLITRPVNRRQGSTGRVRQELDRKVDTLLSRAAPRRIHFCPPSFFFLPILAAYGGRRAVARWMWGPNPGQIRSCFRRCKDDNCVVGGCSRGTQYHGDVLSFEAACDGYVDALRQCGITRHDGCT